MDKLRDLIKSLPHVRYSGGITQTEVVEAQKSIGISFAEDYTNYLLNFGQMQASGIELSGISDKVLTSVVKMTLEERERKSIPDNTYVIEELDIDGIIYVQDTQGIIYEISPGAKPNKVADSLIQYIQSSQK